MFTVACCFVVSLGLGLGLDLVSGWLVVMHTYLYYFRLSLSRTGLVIGLLCWVGHSQTALSGSLCWSGGSEEKEPEGEKLRGIPVSAARAGGRHLPDLYPPRRRRAVLRGRVT